MGSSDFGLPALKKLHEMHDIVCVYTRAPKPAGRGMKVQCTPIHQFATEHDIPVLTPKTLKNVDIKDFQVDLIVVAAYGLILPKLVLDAPKYGCINIHGSLLPSWRGAAPIHYSLLHGDKLTGITIIQMDEGIDTGDILMMQEMPILEEDNYETLHKKLAELGGELTIKTVDQIISHTLKPIKQETVIREKNTPATFTQKVTKEDRVVTARNSVQEVMNKIKTFGKVSFEDAYIIHQVVPFLGIPSNVKTIDLLEIGDNEIFLKLSDGYLKINTIQKPSKKALSAQEFLKGFRR